MRFLVFNTENWMLDADTGYRILDTARPDDPVGRGYLILDTGYCLLLNIELCTLQRT
jgi:hypothetical protein